MKKVIGLIALAALLVLAAYNLHGYGSARTLNQGVYLQLPGGHHCGYEYRGTPGVFCDVS